MPLYEYECQACGHRTEVIQRFNDPPLASCPECAGAVERLISAPAVQFKGTGWYVTDYAGKGKAPAQDGSAEAGAKESPSGEAKPKSGAKKESATPAAPPAKAAAGGDD